VAQLGMSGNHIGEFFGWPGPRQHRMSMRDLGLLAQRADRWIFPIYYLYFNEREY